MKPEKSLEQLKREISKETWPQKHLENDLEKYSVEQEDSRLKESSLNSRLNQENYFIDFELSDLIKFLN